MSIIQGNTKVSAAGGYTIDQSIRFNDDDSAYLSRTFGTPTDATNWTFSTWIKRCNLGTEQWFFNSGASAAAYYIRFETTDKIRFRASTTWDITTTQVFRDVSAWYHIVATFENGAVTLYVNNDSIATASVSDATYNFFTNIIHSIGGSTTGASNSDLYLAETHGIDGQALAPTNFGEYNDDGVWIPKQYAGTYGNNGFYLKGQDSAALGDDSSGNGNDFTSSGLTTADQVSDSPTLNFPVISPIDRQSGSNAVLSDGNLKFTNNNTATSVDARATFALPKGQGKWYFEMEADILGQSGVNREYIGIVTTEYRIDSGGGGDAFWTDANGFSFSTAGSKGNNNSLTSYGSAWSAGDIIGCAVDLDNNKIWWSINNTWQASGDPAAGTNAAFTTLSSDVTYAPAFAVDYGTGTSQIIANFGQTGGLTYTPPTGFSQIDSSTLPEPTIKDGSAYFQTTLYTGNQTARSITGVGFQPDFVWAKNRAFAESHVLYDAVRGATLVIKSNTNGAEATNTQGLTSFDTDGFSLGTSLEPNKSGDAYAAWSWLAANGTASNSDGSITSTVSANTTAGFSIVTYTGDGNDNATVGHGLGVTPKTVWLLPRSNGDNRQVSNWETGVTAFTEDLKLNAAEAANSSSTRVKGGGSTTFTLGTDPNVNGSGRTYLAYVWNEVAGFSKFATYTSNGSTDGPFVYCGFRPAIVFIRCTENGENWHMYDSTRNEYNATNLFLYPTTTDAEGTSGRDIDILSNGFKLRGTDGGINSASNRKYVAMCFAEHPFGGDGVAPVPAR